MELEKQVCNLELAKKLKELGVKQESYFCWAHKTTCVRESFDGEKTEYVEEFSEECELGESDRALWDGVPKSSAFTVAELGEIIRTCLPVGFQSGPRPYKVKREHPYECYPFDTTSNKHIPTQTGATEADARAKMLIYLTSSRTN